MMQNVQVWGVVLLVVVLVWFIWRQCFAFSSKGGSQREEFMPYRCGRTGMNYLDVYEQESYYDENPYGYPNPESYTTAWFNLRNAYDPERYPRFAF